MLSIRSLTPLSRYPGYIYKNPAAVTKDELFAAADITGQLDRAAHVVCATLRYAEQIVNETLEPDSFQGFPLDMLQHSRMFSTARLPGPNRDSVHRHEDPKSCSHIVVIRGCKMWKLDFQSYEKFSFETVKLALKAILDVDQEECLGAPGIGALTCDNRDVWYENRKSLLERGNEESLRAIDDALLVLCLDVGGEDSLEGDMRAARSGNPRHRWFDAPAQLIVRENGKVCSNCEHSWGDGIAMMRWGGEMAKELGKPSYMSSRSEEGAAPVVATELAWDLDEGLLAKIEEAGARADKLADSAKCAILRWDAFGKNVLKEYGVSPDAAMQQVLQLAYMKRHGKTVSTYCVAQHMAFKAGRNERMRGNTPLSKAYVKSVLEGEDATTQYKKLAAACDRHSNLSRQCVMGQGFDRHLYARERNANNFRAQRTPANPVSFPLAGTRSAS